MVSKDRSEAIFQTLIKEIGKMLEKYGFQAESKKVERLYKSDQFRWVRESNWKNEYIYLNRRKNDTLLNIGTDVTHPLENGGERTFGGYPIEYILGKSPNDYRIPLVFGNLRIPLLLNTIVSDTEKALPWFDKYKTPQKCIDTLEKDYEDMPLEKEKKWYKDRIEYLTSIQKEK